MNHIFLSFTGILFGSPVLQVFASIKWSVLCIGCGGCVSSFILFYIFKIVVTTFYFIFHLAYVIL